MAEQVPDLSAAIGKLLENPEALKSAMEMASNLKKSGFFDQFSANQKTGEEKTEKKDEAEEQTSEKRNFPSFLGEYRKDENAYTEKNNAENRTSTHGGDGYRAGSAQRKQLLMALRPYMSRERQERIDTVLKILRLLELAEQLGALNF